MSGSYVVPEGRPENSVNLNDIAIANNNNHHNGDNTANNTYDTLQMASSCSELLPSTASAAACSKLVYLSPYDKSSHSRRHRTRQRHHRSRSTSNVSQTEELKTFFLKIKLGFLFLCIINALVIVFCLLTVFNVFPSEEKDDFMTIDDGEPRSFKLCTKCQPLQAKVGEADGFLSNIRSTKFPDFCCFRRVDQLLEIVDWYAKHYVGQEAAYIKDGYIPRTNATKQSIERAFAHVYWKKENKPSDYLRWMTAGIDNPTRGLRVGGDDSDIVVEIPGFYYIYSHLRFKSVNINENGHRLVISGQLKLENHDNAGISVVQGIFRLEKNDTVSVMAKQSSLDAKSRTSYLGLIRL